MPRRTVAALLAAGAALAGCSSSWPSTVRLGFAMSNACPAERVTVPTEFYDPPRELPPGDVEADPRRMALWSQRRELVERPRPYFVAEGCGLEVAYYCEHWDQYKRSGHTCWPAKSPRPTEVKHE